MHCRTQSDTMAFMTSTAQNNRKSGGMPSVGSDGRRPFRHFTSLAAASIIIILFVAGLGLGHVLRDLIVSEAERDAIQVSGVARDCEIRKYVEQLQGENGQILEIPPSELPIVNTDMRVFAESFDIVKIKIYNVERRIIYSTDPKVVGRSDPHNALLLTALSGTPVSRYQAGDQVWDFEDEEPARGEIAETYVPICDRDGRIIGSLEIYKDISRDLAIVHEILLRSWSVLALTVLGVFAALMFVIRRTVQTIKVTTSNLTTTNEQLQQEVEERKSLEKELLSVIERERQRIGQELHDGIGQQLAGITFMAEVLRGKLRRKSLGKEIPFAGRISTCVGQVAQQTRNLARGLAPIDLDTNGLLPALEELAANTEQLFNVTCTLECDRTVATREASVTINLYRIVQEAITNAIKHGRARNVTIRLTAENGRAELSVESDGLAFLDRQAGRIRQPSSCLSEHANGSGMGLRIMRYRAETINGSLDVREGARGGTLVTCVFPHDEEPTASTSASCCRKTRVGARRGNRR